MDLEYVIKKLENDKLNIENKNKIESMKNTEILNQVKYENEYFKTKMNNEFLITMQKLENERDNRLDELKLEYQKIKNDIEDIKEKKEIKKLAFLNKRDKINLEFRKKNYELDGELLDIKSKKKKIKIDEKLKLNKLNNIRTIETERINGEEKIIQKKMFYNQIKYNLSNI